MVDMSVNRKASICIPSYNHARFLPAAIESALAQTYRDFEIVIVDDGSTDDSLKIAESYAAKYPTLVTVYTHPGKQNRGISATVNLGFEKATGYYYSGLPSDDVLLPEKLEKQIAYLDRHPGVGFVYGCVDLIDENGKTVEGRLGTDITAAADPLARMIEENCIMGMTVMARREAIARVFPHDEALTYSDWDLWTRFVAQSRPGFLPEPLVHYRVHRTNTSYGRDLDVRLSDSLAALRALRAKAPSVEGELSNPRYLKLLEGKIDRLHRQLYQALLHKYHVAASKGELADGFRFFWDAARCAPNELLRPNRLFGELKNALFGVALRTGLVRARQRHSSSAR